MAASEFYDLLSQTSVAAVPYDVEEVYRRTDPSFIQGLYFDADRKQLIESTGLYGQSYTHWLNIDD